MTNRPLRFSPGDTAYCRFTGEAFTVIEFNGCVATLRDSAGNITGRINGDICRRAPEGAAA